MESASHVHRNDERTVECPIEGCNEQPLARGAHLHVRQSSGDGHGPRGEVPEGISFDSLTSVGTREVEMDYPEHRETEQIARLCPYCERPFRGKHGVLIHLGQVRGTKDHPANLPSDLDPDEFPIVHVDDRENIIDVVEAGGVLPTTADREQSDRIEEYIETLEADGHTEEAARAREMLTQ